MFGKLSLARRHHLHSGDKFDTNNSLSIMATFHYV